MTTTTTPAAPATPLWEQLGFSDDSREAGIVAIAEVENELHPGEPVLSGEAVLHLIEVLVKREAEAADGGQRGGAPRHVPPR